MSNEAQQLRDMVQADARAELEALLKHDEELLQACLNTGALRVDSNRELYEKVCERLGHTPESQTNKMAKRKPFTNQNQSPTFGSSFL